MKGLTRTGIKVYLKSVGQELDSNREQLVHWNNKIVVLKSDIAKIIDAIRRLDLSQDQEEKNLTIELNRERNELAQIRKEVKRLSKLQNKLKKALKTQNTILNLNTLF